MSALEEKLGYRFSELKWLEEALTHPSWPKTPNNQRLEFLGDAILGAAMAELLLRLYPKASEGDLARRHAALVCGGSLDQVARELKLGEHLRMAGSEETTGGRENPTNLEDACEAVIGAIFLDGGFEAAKGFVTRHWEALARTLITAPKDAKTALQEWAQGRGLPLPSYTVTESEGPAHAPVFTIEVCVQGKGAARAAASSKKAAEQAAAMQMLQRLGEGA